MEHRQISTAEWHAYVAGFFDGEGSISIARQRARTHSDFHKIIVTLTQDSKHRHILDRVCAEFGGHVLIRPGLTRVSHVWNESARWQLQKRVDIEAFLQTIQPFAIVKTSQIALALEFLAATHHTRGTIRVNRAPNGRILGRIADPVDIASREAMRLRMLDLNQHAARRGLPSRLPPL